MALFGISFFELLVVLLVALVVLGPDKLPPLLKTMGVALGRLRRITSELRSQTGIDELLRREGVGGGLEELRQLLRGDLRASSFFAPPERPSSVEDPASPYPSYAEDCRRAAREVDISRERPVEGCDADGAIAEDLLDPPPQSSLKDQPEPLGVFPRTTTEPEAGGQ